MIDGETPVEMRDGDAAGGADFADFRRSLHRITRVNINFGKMRVERVDAIAVINHHGVPGIIEIFGEYDFARLRGVNRSAGGHGKIYSSMWRAGFTIQHAAAAEIPSRRDALQWNDELPFPKHFRRHGVVDDLRFFLVFFDPLQLLGIRLDKLLSHAQALRGKFPGAHTHRQAAVDGLTVGSRP